MACSVMATAAYSVLAPLLIDHFDISRSVYGFLVAVFSGTGAVFSPLMGSLMDRMRVRSGLRLLFLISASSLISIALSPSVAFLFAATVLAGLGNAVGNPITNKAIAASDQSGGRGWIVGIKQSGVQLAFFLAGIVIPPIALRFGWRAGLLSALVAPLVGAVLTRWSGVGRNPAPHGEPTGMAGRSDGPVDGRPTGGAAATHGVRHLAVYGAMMGLASGSLVSYLPLYVHEGLQGSVSTGGFMAALVGIVGVAARIYWGRATDGRLYHGKALWTIAGLSTTALLLVFSGRWLGILPVWIGAGLAGSSLVAWNSVGMLAVMDLVPRFEVGRASGTVMVGFLGGVTVSPIVAGWIIDSSGSYSPVWFATALLTFGSSFVARRLPRPDGSARSAI